MSKSNDELINFGRDLDRGRGGSVQPGGTLSDPHPKPGAGHGHGNGHEHSNGNHQGHVRPIPVARSYGTL
jgi:hypothetical protein